MRTSRPRAKRITEIVRSSGEAEQFCATVSFNARLRYQWVMSSLNLFAQAA